MKERPTPFTVYAYPSMIEEMDKITRNRTQFVREAIAEKLARESEKSTG